MQIGGLLPYADFDYIDMKMNQTLQKKKEAAKFRARKRLTRKLSMQLTEE